MVTTICAGIAFVLVCIALGVWFVGSRSSKHQPVYRRVVASFLFAAYLVMYGLVVFLLVVVALALIGVSLDHRLV